MYITIWEVREVLQVVKMFCLGSLSRCLLQCKSLSCSSRPLTHAHNFVCCFQGLVFQSAFLQERTGRGCIIHKLTRWMILLLALERYYSTKWIFFWVRLDESNRVPTALDEKWEPVWETQTWWLIERHESLNVELGLALLYHCIILQRGVRGLLWYPIDLRDDDNWCSV